MIGSNQCKYSFIYFFYTHYSIRRWGLKNTSKHKTFPYALFNILFSVINVVIDLFNLYTLVTQ